MNAEEDSHHYRLLRRCLLNHRRRTAERTIAETRQYLDDADELLRTENTAVDFFDGKIERYPNHLARTVVALGSCR